MAYSILEGNPQCEAMRYNLERFRERQNFMKDDASLAATKSQET